MDSLLRPTAVAPSPALAAGLRDAARRLGTPLYAYDAGQLEADARAVAEAFPDPWVRLYSVKANPLPGLVARLSRYRFGASAVSRGEASLALRAGLGPESVALEGIGKGAADLRSAVRQAAKGAPFLWVSIESADEAAALSRLAGRGAGDRALDVLVRVNPSVEPETHGGLAVGRRESKFGVLPDEVGDVLRAGGGRGGPLRWRGVHVHAGSQLRSVHAWQAALSAALDVFAAEAPGLPSFDTVDVGGGFPAEPGEEVPTPAEFARAASDALHDLPESRRPRRMAVEPGRALVARSGWILASVLHVRERGPGPGAGAEGGAAPLRQVVIDAGMTELIRPMLYGAHHPIVALSSRGRPVDPGTPLSDAVVDGPICESTDRLGRALLPEVRRGDLVAIGHAGAYASAMSSTYNGRPHPPEVLLEPDGSRVVLRRRGSIRGLA